MLAAALAIEGIEIAIATAIIVRFICPPPTTALPNGRLIYELRGRAQ
jgi:hypothetical protein